jgi:excisionase family DNA binding protein
MNNGETTLLTPQQVAARLGVTRATVYRRIREGVIPAVQLGPEPRSAIRVDARDLERWLRG